MVERDRINSSDINHFMLDDQNSSKQKKPQNCGKEGSHIFPLMEK